MTKLTIQETLEKNVVDTRTVYVETNAAYNDVYAAYNATKITAAYVTPHARAAYDAYYDWSKAKQALSKYLKGLEE